jgi:hypothetical protein
MNDATLIDLLVAAVIVGIVGYFVCNVFLLGD